MTEEIDRVDSVCPLCLRRIKARLIAEGQTVRMEKDCPQHGSFSVDIWRGPPSFQAWRRPKISYRGGRRDGHGGAGCPFDCGLCPEHGQRTCTALVEVTTRCNLNCPVCFADSGRGRAGEPGISQLSERFQTIFTSTGGCNLQISGGEPTVREDLPEIIGMAREAGFAFIQLNTNGLRLAWDRDLAARYRDAGLSSVFLQFDGIGDAPWQTLRGRSLWAEKQQALDHLAQAGLGVVLVVTVARGVNDQMLWDVARFGMARQPAVRGVHLQPLCFFGRYPAHFPVDHITLPELQYGLMQQSGGILQVDDFHPPGCEHALCSFSGRYLVGADGLPSRLGGGYSCDCRPRPAEEGAQKAIAVTARQWGGVRPAPDAAGRPADDLDSFLARARQHTFSISAMAFQDAWNLNLERLRGCCIHVAPAEGGLIPFCAYNLTAADGRPLHRGRR